MAEYQVNGAAKTATSTRNNGGVGLFVGSAATLLSNVNIGVASQSQAGSTVAAGVNGVNKILSAGTLAVSTPGQYVIPQVTTNLAGVANDTLLSPSADFGDRNAIHKVLHYRTRKVTTAIRAGYWNIYSGTWSVDPTTQDDISTIGATDSAANPSLEIPGLFFYLDGSPNPITDTYEEKTG